MLGDFQALEEGVWFEEWLELWRVIGRGVFFEDVKRRSLNAAGTMWCGDCYMALLTLWTACPKHMTKAELEISHKKLNEMAFSEHPFFSMIRKAR